MAAIPVSEDQNAVAHGLSRCTCANLRMLTRRVSQIYDQKLASSGLTIVQFGILARLVAWPGIAIGDLAERMVMDPTTLTRNLGPLRRDGYLEITSDPSDRRRRIVSITQKGRDVFEKAVPAWRDAQRHVAAALGKSEVADLHAMLARSLDLLSE